MTDTVPQPSGEVPPWHAYCGCYGCRAGAAIAKRAALVAPDPTSPTDTGDTT